MNILLIDDEMENLRALNRVIKRHTPHSPMMLQGVESLDELDDLSFDLLICDQRMPEFKGTDIFEYLRRQGHPGKRILLSAYTDFADVVDSFNKGDIHRFLSKPITNQALIECINSLLKEHPPLATDTAATGDNGFSDILTSAACMEALFEQTRQAATTESAIYIYGETGTGKELLARAIHTQSSHHSGPFIAINCANLTEDMAESQLFGHRKGAYPGAESDKSGILAQVCHGTLFLDEVNDLPQGVQAKLLRVLQDRHYTPLGDIGSRPFNGRIVSASAHPLRQAVSAGAFREDLFYRLNVVPLTIPPLRERHDDCEQLFRHFLCHYSLHACTPEQWQLSDTLRTWIRQYPWPGNVRELQNICAYISSSTPAGHLTLSTSALPSDIVPVSVKKNNESPAPATVMRRPADLDREELLRVLEHNQFKKAQTARQLGISRMTLYRLMKQHKLDGSRDDE
ncbi:sigma-54 dependent transcriptional regulator [Kistimonas scapharcae]|uniref:Sigma-54 dependent transcriptional regulator n=1 Tax=Kistimonas scapharcae TaxID=1036133 RepID=A0ABP8V6E9_9GAMM